MVSYISIFLLTSIQLFLLFALRLDACEIELVIAMDVSRSVDQYEFDLMRTGTSNAFIHPEIIEIIAWMDEGMMVAVTQWRSSWTPEPRSAWNFGNVALMSNRIAQSSEPKLVLWHSVCPRSKDEWPRAAWNVHGFKE